MQIRAIAIVHGKVQGVGFRAATRALALDLGVKGYVENLSDGTVRVVAEAEEDIMENFLKCIEARELFGKNIVSKMDVTRENATGEFNDFSILR
ncbi:Acylphosphatase [uncultured archaeon]|nr:Acylphosphatase [uncultured archaeon]